jgi:hypothetical protein
MGMGLTGVEDDEVVVLELRGDGGPEGGKVAG